MSCFALAASEIFGYDKSFFLRFCRLFIVVGFRRLQVGFGELVELGEQRLVFREEVAGVGRLDAVVIVAVGGEATVLVAHDARDAHHAHQEPFRISTVLVAISSISRYRKERIHRQYACEW